MVGNPSLKGMTWFLGYDMVGRGIVLSLFFGFYLCFSAPTDFNSSLLQLVWDLKAWLLYGEVA
jgi:hypothetical protein